MSSPPASTSQPQPVNGRFSGVHKWPVLSVARGLPTLILAEAPTFVMAFMVAELLYKWHSFTLECMGFLATWTVLGWIWYRVWPSFGETRAVTRQ
jgi:hypothetical protein